MSDKIENYIVEDINVEYNVYLLNARNEPVLHHKSFKVFFYSKDPILIKKYKGYFKRAVNKVLGLHFDTNEINKKECLQDAIIVEHGQISNDDVKEISIKYKKKVAVAIPHKEVDADTAFEYIIDMFCFNCMGNIDSFDDIKIKIENTSSYDKIMKLYDFLSRTSVFCYRAFTNMTFYYLGIRISPPPYFFFC